MEQNASRKQTFIGVVVKAAMKDTATVKVDRYVKNAKYKKYFVRSKKYLAHDPGNTVKVGDTVTIVATRPISKLKRNPSFLLQIIPAVRSRASSRCSAGAIAATPASATRSSSPSRPPLQGRP
ncbi:MAG: 30S ribosomal protein S17 [Parcubacteria group bacterium GW2011_GWB1_55_9]|nr:MAG: 30S ribosomal protein S17 [Parcubacteria group bacterium GW2011_GWB1_55_9]